MATTNTGSTVTRRGQKNTEKNAQKEPQNAAPVVQKPAEQKPQEPAQNAVSQNTRKKIVTHKDLTLQYMMNGIDAIRPLLTESNDPVGQLDKVIETLKDGDQDTKELEALRDYFNDLSGVGQPGRRPVSVGDSREYTVQQQGEDGDLFVRIPVNTLGVQRGQKILASFAENKIMIDVVLS